MIAMTRLDVVPLTQHIGAEIRGLDLHDKPDDETIRAIYQAWLDHLVIVFPNQKLEQEDLVRVTGYFGKMACRVARHNSSRRAIRGSCRGSCSSRTSARTASRSERCRTAR